MTLTTETKIIGALIIMTVVIVIGGVLLFSKQSSINVPKDQIVAESGLHWHPKLTVIVKGEKQEIPADIGMGAVHGKIHTHKEDAKNGVVHMEMPGLVTKDQTTLGKFFLAWGREFDEFGQNVKMRVNGKENKEFQSYLMKDKDIIELYYE